MQTSDSEDNSSEIEESVDKKKFYGDSGVEMSDEENLSDHFDNWDRPEEMKNTDYLGEKMDLIITMLLDLSRELKSLKGSLNEKPAIIDEPEDENPPNEGLELLSENKE